MFKGYQTKSPTRKWRTYLPEIQLFRIDSVASQKSEQTSENGTMAEGQISNLNLDSELSIDPEDDLPPKIISPVLKQPRLKAWLPSWVIYNNIED